MFALFFMLFFVFFDVLNSMSGNADRSSDWVSSQNLMLLQTWLIKPGKLQPGQFYSGLDRHSYLTLQQPMTDYSSLSWRRSAGPSAAFGFITLSSVGFLLLLFLF